MLWLLHEDTQMLVVMVVLLVRLQMAVSMLLNNGVTALPPKIILMFPLVRRLTNLVMQFKVLLHLTL